MADQVFYTLCPKCGGKIRAGVSKCPGCGEVFMKDEKKAPSVVEPVGVLCPTCGKQVRSGAKFCPFCAAKMARDVVKQICPRCGQVAPEGEKFCSECGVAYAPRTVEEIPKPARVQEVVASAATGQKLSQADFFDKHANKATKGWVKWMPRVGIASAVLYLVLMCLMFAWGDTISGAFMIIDVVCVGGLSIAMMRSRGWLPYICFACYNGAASILAFIDRDFSNLLWLAVSIYLAVKMYKIEKAYGEYLRTGTEPKGEI